MKLETELVNIIDKKLDFFKNVIQKTIIHVHKNKTLDILALTDVCLCLDKLIEINKKINISSLHDDNINNDALINNLQLINNQLSSLFKNYGTESFEDFITICFGNNHKIINNNDESLKFDLLKKYFHPISYSVYNITSNESKNKKSDKSNKKKKEMFIEHKIDNFSCTDIMANFKQFNIKVYGINVYIYDSNSNKGIMVNGILDDIIIDFLNNKLITQKIEGIKSNINENNDFHQDSYDRFLSSLSLKDYLINECDADFYNIFAGYISNNNVMKNKSISQNIKDFIVNDMYTKRYTLIQLLINSKYYENQYLAYLLYDLLSNDSNDNVDTQEQIIIFDSFPNAIKQYFKHAMKKTIQYTNDLSNFDINKVPLEQQICLMKVNDAVKEKAMMKLKEVKAKSEDSGSKARQYLDGLLKIPFNIYKREPVLNLMETIKTNFIGIYTKYNINEILPEIKIKDNVTSIEIIKDVKNIKTFIKMSYNLEKIIDYLLIGDKNILIDKIIIINELLQNNHLNELVIKYHGKKKKELQKEIDTFTNFLKLIQKNNQNIKLIEDIYNYFNNFISPDINIQNIKHDINVIDDGFNKINNYMCHVKSTMDQSVYGHDKAKKQIQRIIGQWINGKQDGYCFGFEGPPGVGKCFAKNTPIMLSNGEIKMVQDIKINNKLMGDDSTERNILSLGNGKEKMYKIEQKKGDDYIVNESHILSLKMCKSNNNEKEVTVLNKNYLKNDIIDICIKDYIKLPKYIKDCFKGYKIGLKFEEKPVDLEPYALGCWLANRSVYDFTIRNKDENIVKYFESFTKKYNLTVKKGTVKKGTVKKGTVQNNINYFFSLTNHDGTLKEVIDDKKTQLHDVDIFSNKLKEYNLLNNKHIPNQYKCNSRNIRLQLLAGFIDTNGYYNKKNNSLQISQKDKILTEDILWLIRSLGFVGTIHKNLKFIINKGEKHFEKYYRITITGNGMHNIPVLLERKKPKENNKSRDYLNNEIKVIPLEEGEYFGFEIDGNSRFLLGDFTVAHNTSLAKNGLADCLKDADGENRPFAMIQMGGDSNGSTLHGHNYTYVGSTWGSIVQILIDKGCMNPIIFIDEIDKISKTEHGKEIVGILTHLLDPAQNDCFQDKYFSGIDIDLSKALFILSYNDVDAIDKVLLDRIHRIKFSNLSLEDKLIISKNHMLPEIYKKIGLEDIIFFSDEVLKFIIDEYTCESGVRKLKEIFFEIIGEINLDILKQTKEYDIPIKITIEDIKNNYFKDKREVFTRKVSDISHVGFVNGMYATTIGSGGTLPIHAMFYPCDKFLDLKLTGLQQEVMRESMYVSLTVAWNLTSLKKQSELRAKYDSKNKCGINIHTGDGSVSKDGPSGGCAISCAIYSLLNNITIKHEFGITGEIQMSGDITAIGGLSNKIIGSIKSNVKSFIFPKENQKDFDEFLEKYKDKNILNGISFFPVSHINEVLEIIMNK